MALLGTYNHTLDDKGRLTIPSKLREQFKANKVFISLGFDGCIDVRSEDEWLKWIAKVASTGQATPEGRALARKVMSMSDETTFDNAGRIKLTVILQEKAQISKDVVIIGNNDHLELWDPIVWEKYIDGAPAMEDAAKNFEEKI
ncbi:cell division protein MraZ [Spiroplasma syrphidicola EA-1]|uniref:Transcriptional regulator MraZ n=1 Tax=Spiroplasma syrphidicola EA-1 TaxID=1276229 RepID=R4U484_9MOLU|nr:division/cell wall cluster transcriptional repressor MraZ [Spiroplasma syrphidicola]AGM26267.1 cell division protein MraZ [Spiroplasma syrphidicola EA-1]